MAAELGGIEGEPAWSVHRPAGIFDLFRYALQRGLPSLAEIVSGLATQRGRRWVGPEPTPRPLIHQTMPDFDTVRSQPRTGMTSPVCSSRVAPLCWCSVHRFPVGHRKQRRKRGIHRLSRTPSHRRARLRRDVPLAGARSPRRAWNSSAPHDAQVDRHLVPPGTVLCFCSRTHRRGVTHALLRGAIPRAQAGARAGRLPVHSRDQLHHRGHSSVSRR
jgi:hypothetical protein